MYFWKRCRGELFLLGKLVENFVCNVAYLKLDPVPDWEPMEFFQLKGNVREFRGMGDNPAE